LIKARGRTICSKIHKLINSVWNKEELPEQWQESIIARINKKDDKTEAFHFCQIYIYKIISNILLHKLMPYAQVGNNSVDFNVTGQILFIYSAFVKYLRINGNKRRQCISYI